LITHKRVDSGLSLATRIAHLLEDSDPQHYNGSNSDFTIRHINDVLQGRNKQMNATALANSLEPLSGDEAVEAVQDDIVDFVRQMSLIPMTNNNHVPTDTFIYETFDYAPQNPIKIVTQDIYDRAVSEGFPPDFFHERYFKDVTFYSLPYEVDFSFSRLLGCAFHVCNVNQAYFAHAKLFDCAFHTADLSLARFNSANIMNTRFYDTAMNCTGFCEAIFKHCSFLDCSMYGTDLYDAYFDGCSFDRIHAPAIKHLDTAFFTMGGATPEEVNHNRRMNYAALQGGNETMLDHVPDHDNAPYGTVFAEFHHNGEDDILYVVGTKENGHYVTKDYAAKMLSPAAMRYGVPMGDDAFYFPDASAKPVLFHELPNSQFFSDIKPRERKELVHKLFEQFPEYTKARGLTPPKPAKRRKSPDVPQR